MARLYRFERADCVYHITSRGDDRREIFCDDGDSLKFLEYVARVKTKYKFHVYAYCLMTNHYHLLIETTLANISEIMHYINGSYTNYVNVKYGRSGHVFQGRFKSLVVDTETYFLVLSRYIHLNSVKAKMVRWPHEYRWSSCQGYLGHDNPLLAKDRIKQCLNMSEEEYRQYVGAGIAGLEDIFKNVYAGIFLGSVHFVKEHLKLVRGQIRSKELSYRDDIATDADIDSVIRKVDDLFPESAGNICVPRMRRNDARKVAIYLAKRYTRLTNAEIGGRFGISHSAVSKTARYVERLMVEARPLRRKIVELSSFFDVSNKLSIGKRGPFEEKCDLGELRGEVTGGIGPQGGVS